MFDRKNYAHKYYKSHTMKNKIVCVYGIYYKNECVYIGSTVDFISRKARHKRNSVNTKERCYYGSLYVFIRENGGIDNFDFRILKQFDNNISIQDLRNEEQKYINSFSNLQNKKRTEGNGLTKKEYSKIGRDRRFMKLLEQKKQLCKYDNQYFTLNALSIKLRKEGVEHPYEIAKKYILIDMTENEKKFSKFLLTVRANPTVNDLYRAFCGVEE